ncbi:MAG: hypothetical protein WB502_13220 [Thermoactinomyces sp.]
MGFCKRKIRKRRRSPTLCRHCRRLLEKYGSLPCSPSRHKKRSAPRRSSCKSSINNAATIDGPISGLINIIVQIPINAGDATSLNESNQNAVSNTL